VNTGRFLDNRGTIGLRALFWIVFLSSSIYAAYKIAPPYFSYQMMYYEVRSEAENARHYTNEEIKKRILKKAEDWSIPLKRHNIIIERRTRVIDISMEWDVDIVFLVRYKRTFHYDISVREVL
jgi:hypothetical protein